MTDREAFEAWVSGPPYECEVTRFPEGSAWPGNYRAASVDLAWFAWQAATAATQERCANCCSQNNATINCQNKMKAEYVR